ncbi:hypothetical protein HW115_19415 [Verrucomicrobiaceae bacterium N1E253]|uniref:Uncharacterized protein n=1 Tax=Oceaniferula marina TaxID=2748318 RepID=A0A851GRY6_9BACT|nr:hypothetical protein [Oceaniferula marina]NWK57797.1 hypothetical protein [Oceaniferula marina]
MNLQKQWPNDIDGICPKCGKNFDARVNLTVEPSKYGRTVRKIHSRMLAVPLLGFPILLYKVLHSVGQGNVVDHTQSDLIFITVLGLVVPPVITGLLVLTSKVVRVVRCNSCGYTEDYAIENLS